MQYPLKHSRFLWLGILILVCTTLRSLSVFGEDVIRACSPKRL